MDIPAGKYFYKGEPITPEEIRALPFYDLAKVQREEVGPGGNVFLSRPWREQQGDLVPPGRSFSSK